MTPSNSALRLAVGVMGLATMLFTQSYFDYIGATSSTFEMRSRLMIQGTNKDKHVQRLTRVRTYPASARRHEDGQQERSELDFFTSERRFGSSRHSDSTRTVLTSANATGSLFDSSMIQIINSDDEIGGGSKDTRNNRTSIKNKLSSAEIITNAWVTQKQAPKNKPVLAPPWAFQQVQIVNEEGRKRANKPHIELESIDFADIPAVFKFLIRDERYVAKKISSEELKASGAGLWIYYYRVQTALLPVYNSVKPFVELPLNGESAASFLKRKQPEGNIVRILERGDYLMGVETMPGPLRNSQWTKIAPGEYVPVFNKVVGTLFVVVHLKKESKIPALTELNSKPFERRSRDCSMVRENLVRTACFKFANAIKESRRILRDFNLLHVVSTNETIWPAPPEPNESILEGTNSITSISTTLEHSATSSSSTATPNASNSTMPREVIAMLFHHRMQQLFRPMSEIEICASSEWTQCTLHAFCTWTYATELGTNFCSHDVNQPAFPQQGVFSPSMDSYNRSFDFVDNPQHDKKKYFVYQPSGGINNQRIQLEIALTICLITHRTCVLPHVAQHTNYYFRYNMHPASRVISMQRVFDFNEISNVVDIVSLPEHLSLMQWVESVGGLPYVSQPTGLEADPAETNGWRVVMRDARKMINKYIWKDSHVRRFATDPARFLFFANHTMWGTIDLWPWSAKYKLVRNSVTFTQPTKQLAVALSDRLGLYNALHVRRGDKKKEASFLSVVRDADVYGKRMLPYAVENPHATNSSLNNTLYISTDEKDFSYFDPIRELGFDVLTWHDLDQQLLLDYIYRFPPQMFHDVLGMVEQLVCVYANKFLGSSYSTYSIYILRMRRFYPTIAVYNTTTTSFTTNATSGEKYLQQRVFTHQPKLKQSVNFSHYESDCNPFRPESHRNPC